MKKTLKIVGYTLGVILLLVVAAAIALPFIVNPNDYKGEITKLVHDKTGRDLTIAGDIRLSVFPWLGVEVNGVTLSNAPGFGAQPFASIDEADVSVRLLPLIFRRQVRVGTVKLTGLKVHLARHSDGTTNWADLAQAGGGGQPANKGGGAGVLAALTVGGVEIDDAAFAWADGVSGHHYALKHLRLTAGAVAIGQAFPLKLAFDVESDSPPVSGHVDLDAEVTADPSADNYRIDELKSQFDITDRAPALQVKGHLVTAFVAHPAAGRYTVDTGELHFTPSGDILPLNTGELILAWHPIQADLKAQTADISSLQLSGLGLRAIVEAQAEQLFGTPRVSGRIDLPAASPDTLVKALRRGVPAGLYPAELGQVGAQARFDYDAGSGAADLKGLVIAALGAELHADAHLAKLGDSPTVEADLEVPEVAGKTVFSHLGTLVPANLRDRDIGNLAFSAHVSGDPGSKTFKVSDISAEGFGVGVHGAVTTTLAGVGPQVQGTLELPPFALARAAAFAGVQLPKGLDTAALGQASLKTRFSADLARHTLSVSGLQLEALGLSVSGEVKGQGVPRAPVLDVSLKVPAVASSAVLAHLKGLAPKRIDPKALGKIGLDTDFALDVNDQALQLRQLVVDAGGVQLRASGRGAHLFSTPTFNGNLQIPAFSPRKVLDALDISVPTADRKALSRLSLSTKVSAGTDSAALKDIDITLDDTRIRGGLSMDNPAKPAVRFQLSVDRLDADRYLPPAAQKKSQQQGGSIDAIKLPVALLAGLDVDGRVTVGQLRAFSIRSTDDVLVLHVADKRLRAHPLSAKLYGGTYSGDVQVDASGAAPVISMDETAAHIGVGKLVKDLSGIEHLSGTGDFHIKLSGRGETLGAIRKTLDGEVGFSLQDGAIEGVDLWGSIRTAYALLAGKPRPPSSGSKRTEFTELKGTGKVQDGVLDNRDLEVKLPFLRVTGAGKLNLVKQTIAYQAQAKVIGTPRFPDGENLSDLTGLTIPLDIGGTFTKPTVKPDLKSVIGDRLKKKVEEKAKDKLKNALKDIFGGGG